MIRSFSQSDSHIGIFLKISKVEVSLNLRLKFQILQNFVDKDCENQQNFHLDCTAIHQVIEKDSS